MTYSNAKKLMLSTSFLCFGAVQMAQADQVFNDDVIVDNDLLCVGEACVDGEALIPGPGERDGIKIKNLGVALLFDDASNPGFPDNDWQFTINDRGEFGREAFILEDITGGTEPFIITAGARDNALFMDANGRIGMGTAVPTNDFHIKTGNNPSVRLEQDSSNGFIPQTWDFAGNGTLFFVRDVTNGNKLPFVVRAGAPNNAFGINSNGYVGVGTSTAAENLHVRGPGNQVTRIESTNNGNAVVQLQSGSQQRKILGRDAAGNVRSQILMYNEQVRIVGPTTNPADTYLIIGANGISTRGPNCNPGPCDATFDPDEFTVPSIEDHAAYMWENQHLWAVGPTKPHEPFNITQKAGGMLHELEVAHIYIEQLHERLKKETVRNDEMQARLQALEDAVLSAN